MTVMTYELHRHDARHLSEILAPESVDLIVTSPPYFALRSYRDGGEHYVGQLGSEATPGEFVDNLIACTADWLKVLKPSGSLFVNLSDKFSGAGPTNNAGFNERCGKPSGKRAQEQGRQQRPTPGDGIPAKSRMALPWRYAIRCIDELGLILRADIIWSKPNGLPESVTDRVRMSHEYLFHFTRQGRYFAAIDEVREEQAYPNDTGRTWDRSRGGFIDMNDDRMREHGLSGRVSERVLNPLGKVPGSVWTMPSEPLVVPEHLGVDHFAAFPSELPRRCILGWTPSGWCVECGEARRPVVERERVQMRRGVDAIRGPNDCTATPINGGANYNQHAETSATITGYACACGVTPEAHTGHADPGSSCRQGVSSAASAGSTPGSALPPTRPAVVLDPFAGTGTTPAVAHLLGRHGIGTDLSNDYLRLAAWRCTSDRALRDKVLDRTGIPNPQPPRIDGQLDLFAEGV